MTQRVCYWSSKADLWRQISTVVLSHLGDLRVSRPPQIAGAKSIPLKKGIEVPSPPAARV